jgi:hypothetical protein
MNNLYLYKKLFYVVVLIIFYDFLLLYFINYKFLFLFELKL